MRFRIAVILLNYRTPQLTLECLESLEGELDAEQDIAVIVENGSQDGSVGAISGAIQRRGWGRWTRLLPSETNLGFAGGCNLGIRSVEADAYLLLNNDTLVRPGAMASLLRAAKEHPEAGIIGARLEHLDGTPQVSCFHYQSPVSECIQSAATGPVTRLLRRFNVPIPASDVPMEPDWVCFAAALIRREVIDQIGYLEDGYFLYFDDVDYCRRARRAGCRVLHWPEARVVHLVGRSNPLESSKAERRRKPRYYYESRARYFAKFYGRVGLWAANLLWMAGRAVSLSRELVGNKRPHTCPREWLDNWMNWLHPFRPPTRWNGDPT